MKSQKTKTTLTGVYQHMASHGSVESKRLGADGAHVWTLARMTPLVITHLVQPREMSATVLTREWTLTCVTTSCLYNNS